MLTLTTSNYLQIIEIPISRIEIIAFLFEACDSCCCTRKAINLMASANTGVDIKKYLGMKFDLMAKHVLENKLCSISRILFISSLFTSLLFKTNKVDEAF